MKLIGFLILCFGLVEIISVKLNYLPMTNMGEPLDMRWTTALNFCFAGIMLGLLGIMRYHDKTQVAVGLLGFLQIFLLNWQFVIGKESLAPSFGTVIGFTLSGAVGISAAFDGKYHQHRRVAGALLTFLAVCGLTAHMFHIPWLYAAWGTFSVGMALPVVLAFFPLGIGLIAIPERVWATQMPDIFPMAVKGKSKASLR